MKNKNKKKSKKILYIKYKSEWRKRTYTIRKHEVEKGIHKRLSHQTIKHFRVLSIFHSIVGKQNVFYVCFLRLIFHVSLYRFMTSISIRPIEKNEWLAQLRELNRQKTVKNMFSKRQQQQQQQHAAKLKWKKKFIILYCNCNNACNHMHDWFQIVLWTLVLRFVAIASFHFCPTESR